MIRIMVDNIVELDNDRKYVLLENKEVNDTNYYFALRLDDKEEPTNNYLFFEEIKEDDETYLDPVEDESIKKLLITLFTANWLDKIYDEV